jgi:hypothetical protein
MEYYDYKRVYADTGIFYTASGAYTGYVEVLSGVPYIDNTSVQLSLSNTFETDLLVSRFFKNRSITDDLPLPNNENEVLLQGNDFLTSRLFYQKLKNLQDNNTFLYSRSFMPNNDLPITSLIKYYGVETPTDTTFSAYTNYSDTILFGDSAVYFYLSGINQFNFALNTDDSNSFSVFAITDTEFISLTGNNTELNVIERSSYVDSVSGVRGVSTPINTLTFGRLDSICRADNYIFISDVDNNNVYKYDIGGYFNGDLALANRRNYIEAIGGKGRITDNNRFNKPKHLATNGTYLVVHDSGNYGLKIYNTRFNYVGRITTIPLKREELQAIEFNPYFNLLYIITKVSNTLKLYIFDECFVLQERNILPITLVDDETVKNIEFSYNNSDYYYICTNKQIYKFFVSRSNVAIGRISEDIIFTASASTDSEITPSDVWNNTEVGWSSANWIWNGSFTPVGDTGTTVISMFADNYKGFRVMPVDEDYDKILIITKGRLYVINELNTFKKIIKPSNLYSFGAKSIGINLDDEFIQTSVVNRELYKVLRDIFSIKNNLIGRFFGEYDYKGIVKLKDYNYNIDFSKFANLELEDYYIHDNEKSIVSVINRCLSNILLLQKQLLELTKVDDQQSVVKVLGTTTTKLKNTLIIN